MPSLLSYDMHLAEICAFIHTENDSRTIDSAAWVLAIDLHTI